MNCNCEACGGERPVQAKPSRWKVWGNGKRAHLPRYSGGTRCGIMFPLFMYTAPDSLPRCKTCERMEEKRDG